MPPGCWKPASQLQRQAARRQPATTRYRRGGGPFCVLRVWGWYHTADAHGPPGSLAPGGGFLAFRYPGPSMGTPGVPSWGYGGIPLAHSRQGGVPLAPPP